MKCLKQLYYVLKLKNNKNTDSIGRLSISNVFTSESMMTLNVKIKAHYSEKTESSTPPLFKLSPQVFEHEIWKQFNEVTLTNNFASITLPNPKVRPD